MTKIQKVNGMSTLWTITENSQVIGYVQKIGPNFYSVEPATSDDHAVVTVSYLRDAIAALPTSR